MPENASTGEGQNEKAQKAAADTDREVAESMTGLWQAERERADRLEAMCDRLAERLVVLPDLWREEGRGVLFNRAGDDLTPQARVGKWLHEKTIIPPGVASDE